MQNAKLKAACEQLERTEGSIQKEQINGAATFQSAVSSCRIWCLEQDRKCNPGIRDLGAGLISDQRFCIRSVHSDMLLVGGIFSGIPGHLFGVVVYSALILDNSRRRSGQFYFDCFLLGEAHWPLSVKDLGIKIREILDDIND